MNAKMILNKLYSSFSKQADSVEARCSALVQAVGIMTGVCGSLKVLQLRNPNAMYVPADSEKLWDRANKCKAQAMGTTFIHEKEVSLRMCLLTLQKMAAKVSPPNLEDFIARLEVKQKAKAEKVARDVIAKAKRTSPRAPKVVGSTASPRSVKSTGHPSNLAPLGPDGVPQWRPGSSADIITQVLFSKPQITKEEVVAAVTGKFQSSNLVCRVMMVAGFLIKFGKLRRVKVNGKPGWERI